MTAQNVALERVFVWRSPTDGTIHLTSDDRRLIDPASGEYKGMNVMISRSRQPRTWARLDVLLRREVEDGGTVSE